MRPAGSSLALAGPAGEGKSTVADVDSRSAYSRLRCGIDWGSNPAEALTTWPRAAAYVPQDVAAANYSVRKNVALGPLELCD